MIWVLNSCKPQVCTDVHSSATTRQSCCHQRCCCYSETCKKVTKQELPLDVSFVSCSLHSFSRSHSFRLFQLVQLKCLLTGSEQVEITYQIFCQIMMTLACSINQAGLHWMHWILLLQHDLVVLRSGQCTGAALMTWHISIYVPSTCLVQPRPSRQLISQCVRSQVGLLQTQSSDSVQLYLASDFSPASNLSQRKQ